MDKCTGSDYCPDIKPPGEVECTCPDGRKKSNTCIDDNGELHFAYPDNVLCAKEGYCPKDETDGVEPGSLIHWPETKVSTTVTYQCNDEFEGNYSGTVRRHCAVDGKWGGVISSCNKDPDCPRDWDTINQIWWEESTGNKDAVIQCLTSDTMLTRFCNADGIWNKVDTENVCPQIRTAANTNTTEIWVIVLIVLGALILLGLFGVGIHYLSEKAEKAENAEKAESYELEDISRSIPY